MKCNKNITCSNYHTNKITFLNYEFLLSFFRFSIYSKDLIEKKFIICIHCSTSVLQDGQLSPC